MKGEKSELWAKAPKVAGLKEGANELLEKSGGISMKVGSGKDPGGEAKAGYKKMAPTLEKVAGGDIPADKGGASKSAKKDAYAGEMGTGKDKLSKMAQVVGKARKGY